MYHDVETHTPLSWRHSESEELVLVYVKEGKLEQLKKER